MELTAYLRILRQRWRLLLAPVVGALAIAALTLPSSGPEPITTTAENYTATATLITSPPTAETPVMSTGLAVVGLFATVGEVPERAAKILDYPGEPQMLASLVTVTPQDATGTVSIATTDPDADAAAARVNAFARATVDFFRDRQAQEDAARAEVLQGQLDRTTQQLERAQARAGDGSNAVVEAQVSALQTQYSAEYNELNELNRNVGASDLVTLLQPGVPIPQSAGAAEPIPAPSSPFLRIGAAALLGLLLGGALALVVERLDSRMRTREQAEDAIGLPVLAEVPLMAKRQREGIVSAERPASTVAEAFRGLRSSVLLLSPTLGHGAAPRKGRRDAIVVMVTSALPGAGKTTTVANLAAVMAEAGRRVLVLSLDLRNPTVHQHFGLANSTGLSELLSADRGRHLEQVVHETSLPGVSIATSGHDTDHPGALLASVGPLLEAARTLADVVLVDAPPMLTVSDALDLARHTDVTLLVSRLNKTTRAQAQECQRLFRRLGVSALGTVLVGSRPAGARYGYPVVAPSDTGKEEELEGAAVANDDR